MGYTIINADLNGFTELFMAHRKGERDSWTDTMKTVIMTSLCLLQMIALVSFTLRFFPVLRPR